MPKAILAVVCVYLFGIVAVHAGDETKTDRPQKDVAKSSASEQQKPKQQKPKQQKPKQQKPSVWMKQKLTYSQRILNGLAIENYDMIEENAIAMQGMSRIEGFVRGRTEGYRTQLKTFEFATSELIRTAEQENLDGATLAFTQMTISCVNCHKEIRNH